MTPTLAYGLLAVGIIGLALHSLIARAHLLARLIAANVLGSGVFLLFVALARRGRPGAPVDPLPHAMVLTGIVVTVAATGLTVALLRRLHAETGHVALPEDLPPPDRSREPERGGP